MDTTPRGYRPHTRVVRDELKAQTSYVTTITDETAHARRIGKFGRSVLPLGIAVGAVTLIPNDLVPRGDLYSLAGGLVTGHTLTLNAMTLARRPHAELDALLDWLVGDYLDELPRVRKWARR